MFCCCNNCFRLLTDPDPRAEPWLKGSLGCSRPVSGFTLNVQQGNVVIGRARWKLLTNARVRILPTFDNVLAPCGDEENKSIRIRLRGRRHQWRLSVGLSLPFPSAGRSPFPLEPRSERVNKRI